MRSLLLIGLIALAAGFSGIGAFAAPMREVAAAPNAEMVWLAQASAPDRADKSGKAAGESFAAAAGTIGVLAGVGLIGTLAAVGLRRIWVKSPLRDPYLEGPA